jgi:hypothetical protein
MNTNKRLARCREINNNGYKLTIACKGEKPAKFASLFA